MMRQYRSLKDQHPDAILFFRMGDFYEMFYEDATLAAPVLDIALTSRHDDTQGAVPMCGIPHHAVEGYLARLIREGFKVALCEQMEDPRHAKGLVKREVVRVISPGTATQPEVLDEKSRNYLVALAFGSTGVGLAYAELSTGEFHALELDGVDRWSALWEEWTDLEPREVLLPETGADLLAGVWKEGLPGAPLVNTLPIFNFDPEEAEQALRKTFGLASLEGLGLDEIPLGVGAAGALLHYLRQTQGAELGHLRPPTRAHRGDRMALDAATRRNLELLRAGPEGERAGSLLELIDHALTPMGGRRLRDWLLHPLIRLKPIVARHQAVRSLVDGEEARRGLRELLKGVADMERLLSRLHLGAANARDLRHLCRSLQALAPLREALAGVGTLTGLLLELAENWDDLVDVVQSIDEALVEEPPFTLQEGGLIRPGFHPEIDRLHLISRDVKAWIRDYEEKERERTGIRGLKIVYHRVFGYCIEVGRRQEAQVPADYTRRQSLRTSERYITEDLKLHEEEVMEAQAKTHDLEYKIFQGIREKVLKETGRIQGAADRVATLDALLGFSEAAVRYGYAEPAMDEGDTLKVCEGRHPVVERISSDPEARFVPNDTHLNSSERQILIVTGPNMAGKSTYIRQVALIVLLAQIGSFVPARSARIGLVDRIFTRVGAHDRLLRGQSGFMVEMVETAHILNQATPRSLVILDEIGRGTSTFDGISIAWAVAEFLHGERAKGPRTLFATHYHELADLSRARERVFNVTMAIREHRDEIIFLRRVVEGSADRSYGIQVARLAGLPSPVIQRARQILFAFEESGAGEKGPLKERAAAQQLGLFGFPPSVVVSALREMELDQMTPLEALNALQALKEKALEELPP